MKKFLSFLKVIANSLVLCALAYAISVALSTATFHLIEGWPIASAYYWSVVTSVTVGYGDYTPKTELGMVVAAKFILFWGYFFYPFFLANILRWAINDPDSFTHQEQEKIKEDLSRVLTEIEELKTLIKEKHK